MEKMNEVMGRLGSPRGSVRILLSDPSTSQKQPLYTNERLRGSRYVLEDGTMKRRHFEHDIFLRLAKRTLVGRVVPEYWEGVIQIPSNPEEEALKRMEKARLERIRNIEDLKTKTEELNDNVNKNKTELDKLPKWIDLDSAIVEHYTSTQTACPAPSAVA